MQPGPLGSDIITEPDPLLQAVTVQVPAHSVIQTTVVATTAVTQCPISIGAAPYHVIVTSDQPGFSYVTGVSNEVLPKFPAATSLSE